MAKKRKAKRRSKDVGPAEVANFFSTLAGRFLAGVFSADKKEPWPRHFRRLWIGAVGGVFYACLKNFASEGIGIVELLTIEAGARRVELFLGYFVGAAMSGAAGGVTAWLSLQKSGRLLFLIGMFGVMILLSLFPALQTKSGKNISSFIEDNVQFTVAYAQTDERCVGDSPFSKGFKAFFGVREQFDKYAVVVASGKTPADAEAKLKRINADDPNLKLRVGPRACDNNYYPVFASDYLPLKEAKAVLERVRRLDSAPDAYLSPGPLE